MGEEGMYWAPHVSPAHPPPGTSPPALVSGVVGAEKGPCLETSQEQAGMFAGHTHRGLSTSTNECSTDRQFFRGIWQRIFSELGRAGLAHEPSGSHRR